MRKLTIALVALLLAGTAACSDDDDTASPTPTTGATTSAAPPATSATGTAEEIRALPGNRFSQTAVTLRAGQSVLVRNADPDVPHNFVVAGVGRSDTMNSGDTFTLPFPKAGTYEFVCTFHQGMDGTITVS